MSEKNKIKIEKKLVASFALIIAIGIASIVPLAIFMGAAEKVSAQTIATDSLFNIDITCAYYNADVIYNVEINSVFDGSYRVHNVWYRDAAVIDVQPLINYDALDKTTMARIELFEYTVYTDKLVLQKSYSYFAFNESAFGQGNVNGHSSSYIFAYYQDYIGSKCRGSDTFVGNDLTDYIIDPTKPMSVWSGSIVGNSQSRGYGQNKLDKEQSNILDAIKDVQAVYLDVKRVAYISLSIDGTVIAVEDNKLLQHLELTKTADGFMFGDPATIGREIYFGLPQIPYKGTDVPEEFWPIIWPDKFGA